MLLSSEGIVLGSIKYGDSSTISHVFSKEKGLISLISSTPKKGKSSFKSYLQPLCFIDFVCYNSKKSSINRLKEVSFCAHYNEFQADISTNSLRYFIAEFLSKIIKEEEQNHSLYLFLEKELKHLQDVKQKSGFHITFLIDLLTELGIQPHLNDYDLYFDLIEGSSVNLKPHHQDFYSQEILQQFQNVALNRTINTKIERTTLLNVLLKYYSIQLNIDVENLKTKQVFEVVFS